VQHPGLRERKKQATRDGLIDAALELFDEQGVDETSVEQIAERVDVSPRTFYRYFAAKDDVLFADTGGRADRVAAVLRADDSTRSLLDVLCGAAVELASMLVSEHRRSVLRFRVIEGNDRLRAHFLRDGEEVADLCAAHAARRLGLAPGDLLPRLLGSCTVGALRAAHRRWLADPDLDIVAEVRTGFAVLADLDVSTNVDATTRAR